MQLEGIVSMMKDIFQTDTLVTVLVVLTVIAGVTALVLIYMAVKLKKIADRPAEVRPQDWQPPVPAAAPASAPAVPMAAGSKGELVAVIAAAVAETMGEDVSHLQIHSIRRIG